MKNISFIIFIILFFNLKSFAQSTTITPEDGIIGQYTNQKISILTDPNTYGFEHTNGVVSIATFVGNSAAWLMTKSNHPLYFSTNNYQGQTPGIALLTNGNVGIGTSTPTEKLHVMGNVRISGLGGNGLKFVKVNILGGLSSAPQLTYMNIPRASFLPINGNMVGVNSSNGGIYCTGNTFGSLEAPINLPDGAVITNVVPYYADNGTRNVKVQVYRRAYSANTSTPIGSFSSTGELGTMNIQSGDIEIDTDNIVDNNTYVYYIRVSAVILLNNTEIGSAWGDGTTLTINHIKIIYNY
jgi:hypothetical protein